VLSVQPMIENGAYGESGHIGTVKSACRGCGSKTAKLETASVVRPTVRVSLVGLERLFATA
jgi:hypothetical protein